MQQPTRKPPGGGGPAWLVLLATPVGAALGLGALIVLAHVLPELGQQRGGGPLGTFIGVFVVAAALALALAYRRWLAWLTGWRGTLWLLLWLVVLLLEGLLLK